MGLLDIFDRLTFEIYAEKSQNDGRRLFDTNVNNHVLSFSLMHKGTMQRNKVARFLNS